MADVKADLEEKVNEMQDILESMLLDMEVMVGNKSAARRVRSSLTKIKKTGKDLRRLSLEYDKTL